ncbi:MAG: energy transducer TonB, partial [SAR324 cluster bacterium]|nr:energy transducer TonB [SAR324 cluster bacterium]
VSLEGFASEGEPLSKETSSPEIAFPINYEIKTARAFKLQTFGIQKQTEVKIKNNESKDKLRLNTDKEVAGPQGPASNNNAALPPPSLGSFGSGGGSGGGTGDGNGQGGDSFSQNLFTRAKLRHAPSPPYPERARLAGFEGKVILKVFIDDNGNIANTSIQQSSGRSDCDIAALKTIQDEWHFEPAQLNGQAVPFQEKVIVVYALD